MLLLQLALSLVPSTSDLQLQIDSAVPGAVIKVYGRNAPVRITKPVTLLAGDSTALIGYLDPPVQSPITLAGSGGSVTLVGLTIGGEGAWPFDGFHEQVSPCIEGAGFERVLILGCTLEPMDFFGATSLGASAISLAGPGRLLLDRTRVQGAGADGYDVTWYGTSSPPAVVAPEAWVFAKQSVIRGGSAGTYDFPGTCADTGIQGGMGGHGVVAWRFSDVGCVVEGGAGGTWTGTEGEACYTADAGAPVVELGPSPRSRAR